MHTSKRVLQLAAGVSLAAIGLLSDLTGTLGLPTRVARPIGLSVLTASAFLLVCAGGYLLYSFWQGRGTRVPDLAGYELMAASVDDIYWAATTASRVYRGPDVIPTEIMLDWYRANPLGFSVIKTLGGRTVGNLDLLPLKPATLERFLRGDLLERDITGDCLYKPEERNEIHNLYLESFVALTRDLRRKPNAAAVLTAMRAFPEVVARICDPSQVERIYAIAASDEGDKGLSLIGFQRVRDAGKRRDHHNVYCGDYPSIKARLARLTGSGHLKPVNQ